MVRRQSRPPNIDLCGATLLPEQQQPRRSSGAGQRPLGDYSQACGGGERFELEHLCTGAFRQPMIGQMSIWFGFLSIPAFADSCHHSAYVHASNRIRADTICLVHGSETLLVPVHTPITVLEYDNSPPN
jgi:hypothetical protein